MRGKSRRGLRFSVLFRVLGKVSVVGDPDEMIVVGARRQRALLARLIIDTNRVVSRSALVESVWGDELPVHPETALHVVVSRLRTTLGPYGSRIVAEATGYRLDAGPDEVDLLLAESLLRDGRLALASNEGSRRGRRVRAGARALDRRPAPGCREDSCVIRGGGSRLRELRVMLVEARNDAYPDGRPPPRGAERHRLLGDIRAAARAPAGAADRGALPRGSPSRSDAGRAKPSARRCATRSGWIPRSRSASSNGASSTRTRAWSRPTPGS